MVDTSTTWEGCFDGLRLGHTEGRKLIARDMLHKTS